MPNGRCELPCRSVGERGHGRPSAGLKCTLGTSLRRLGRPLWFSPDTPEPKAAARPLRGRTREAGAPRAQGLVPAPRPGLQPFLQTTGRHRVHRRPADPPGEQVRSHS